MDRRMSGMLTTEHADSIWNKAMSRVQYAPVWGRIKVCAMRLQTWSICTPRVDKFRHETSRIVASVFRQRDRGRGADLPAC